MSFSRKALCLIVALSLVLGMSPVVALSLSGNKTFNAGQAYAPAGGSSVVVSEAAQVSAQEENNLEYERLTSVRVKEVTELQEGKQYIFTVTSGGTQYAVSSSATSYMGDRFRAAKAISIKDGVATCKTSYDMNYLVWKYGENKSLSVLDYYYLNASFSDMSGGLTSDTYPESKWAYEDGMLCAYRVLGGARYCLYYDYYYEFSAAPASSGITGDRVTVYEVNTGCDHQMTFYDQENPPCSTGHIAYYSCSKCNKVFADEAGNQPLESVKADHHFGDPVEDDEAYTITCGVCGKTMTYPKDSRSAYMTLWDVMVKFNDSGYAWVPSDNDDYAPGLMSSTSGMDGTPVSALTLGFRSDRDFTLEFDYFGSSENAMWAYLTLSLDGQTIRSRAGGEDGYGAHYSVHLSAGDHELYAAYIKSSESIGGLDAGFLYNIKAAVDCDHQWVRGQTVAPTCTEKGFTPYTCAGCNGYDKREIVAPLGHTWETTSVVAPTCTEGGYTAQVCATCKEKRTIDVQDALGHDFSRYVSNDNDTHTQMCIRCDAVSEAEDAVSAHHFVNGVCDKCQHVYVRPVIDASYAGPWTCAVAWSDDEVPSIVITGYDVSRAQDQIVVPASVAGVPVREIGEDVFAGISGTVIIPDTVTAINANAFRGSNVTSVELMGCPGAVSVIGGSTVSLPDGASIRSFRDNLSGANVSTAWRSVFGNASSVLIEDTDWSFHLDYANGAQSVPQVAVDGDQGWGYHGASDSSLYKEIPATYAGFDVTQLGERVFNVTGTQYDNETKLGMLRIPATVAAMHKNALAKCDATVLFEGACPAIMGGAQVPTVPYTTFALYYSDNPDTVDTWTDCGWSKVGGTYDWGLEVRWLGYKWNVVGYHGTSKDITIPNEYADHLIDTVETHAIDATGLNSITIDDLVYSFQKECIYNLECPLYFKGRPHGGVDYEHEFVGVDGNTTKAPLYYEISYENSWLNSQWVKNGKYNCTSYQSNINRYFTYKQVGPNEYMVSGFLFNYLDDISSGIHARGILQLPSTLDGDEVLVNGYERVVEDGVVVGVADDAFYCEDWIVRVYIPETYRSLGYEAFWGCSALQEVLYNGGVESSQLESVGERCFWYCDPMVRFDVPKSLTSIADGAFICAGLKRFNVASENPAYCDVDGVLFSKDMTELCMYPEGIEDRSYTVPESVTYIHKEALRGSLHACHLAEINLPSNLQKIGWGAFLNNELLISMTLPESLVEMEGSVFAYCTNLRSVNIPENITMIPACAFDFCEGLTDLRMHDNITYIDEAAFEYCTSLELDSLPAKLQGVGECAFRHCERLNVDLSNLNELTIVNAEGFSTTGLRELVLPSSLMSIGKDAFAGNYALKSVDFGNSKLSVLPYGAFQFCTQLTQVILPSRITSVGERAFFNCISLAGKPVAFCSTGSMTIGDETFSRQHPDNEEYIIEIGIQAYAYPRTEAAAMFPDYVSLEVFVDTSDVLVEAPVNQDIDLIVEASTERGNLKYLWDYEGRVMADFTGPLCTVRPTHLGESQAVVEIWHEYNPDERVAVVVTVNANDDKVLPLPGTVDRGSLGEMLSAADNALNTTVEADDGLGVNDNEWWSTPACFKVLREAVSVAQGVNRDAYATQEQVQAAADMLQEEIADFNGALQSGWRIPPRFSDVDYNSSDAYYIQEAWRLNLMQGSEDGTTFGVAAMLSRLEAIDILYRICVKDVPEGWDVNDTPFTDVEECDEYTNAVNWAYERGILSASGDSPKARPSEPITRAEMAYMVWVAANRPSASSVDVILDADDAFEIPKESRRAMAWAVEQGILDVDESSAGLFLHPQDGMTKGVAAKSVVMANSALQTSTVR